MNGNPCSLKVDDEISICKHKIMELNKTESESNKKGPLYISSSYRYRNSKLFYYGYRMVGDGEENNG